MIITLIGAPLAGKTTVLKKLQEAGVKVFSADSHVTTIYKAGQPGYIKIKEELGEEFVNEVAVDKMALAAWASEEDNLHRLNELIHPLIAGHLEGKDGFVAELPIITTSPVKFKYDKVVLVKASEEKMIERFAKTRISNPDFVKKIIEDWNNNEIAFDYVIDTTNDVKEEDINNIIRLIDGK